MNAPIRDFVKKYADGKPHRFHMPGHKGVNDLGAEALDVTEIDGADCLFQSCGIIEESRKNARSLFGAETFYSTEGSSLAIRAMVFLAVKHAKANGKTVKIAAGRNAHKSFVSACAIMDVDVDWLYPKSDEGYLSCTVTKESFGKYLSACETPPCALYLTSPDYLGNVTELDELSQICRRNGILLLVDDAHGAYLKFLKNSLHPVDHGADMCCDSAHKTLPCLTGGAYLHIRSDLKDLISDAEDALSLFGTTSPSYLILQSLDGLNEYLSANGKNDILKAAEKTATLKGKLLEKGYSLVGDEPLKITLKPKPFGYTGRELNEYLKTNGIFCEFYDDDYLVLMLSCKTQADSFNAVEKALVSLDKKTAISECPPPLTSKKAALNFNQAVLAPSEKIPVQKALGRIAATVSVACPPAVPIVVCGEIIDENAIRNFDYYKIKTCNVIKRP